MGNTGLYSLFSLYLYLYQTVNGNRKDCFEAAQKAYEDLAACRPGFFLTELGELLAGAVASEAGEYGIAEKHLLSSMQTALDKHETQLYCAACLHLGYLYYLTGRPRELNEYLRRALQLASGRRYHIFPSLLPRNFVTLAACAVSLDICRDFTYDMIDANLSADKSAYFRKHASAQDPNILTGKLIILEEKTTSAQVNQIYASFFGVFRLRINGVTVPKSKYATRKNESILKYLLFNKRKSVSKERLIELFWPDSDRKSGFSSMRTALHGIRKIFSEYGAAPVITENNGCLEIAHPEFISSDVEMFLQLNKKYDELDRDRANSREGLVLLEKLVGLYKGNLLEEGLYEDWVFFEREELKTIYFCAVDKLAVLYLQAAEYEKAENALLRALSFDPYNAELSLQLIRVFIDANQPGRAFTYYSNYKNLLKQELDIEPDERFSALFGKAPKER
jgi:DNA-binding SARP family transcriptional activator